MVVQSTTPTHAVGDLVTVWFDADHVYVGRVDRVHPEHLVVHLFEYSARVKVCPTYALKVNNS